MPGEKRWLTQPTAYDADDAAVLSRDQDLPRPLIVLIITVMFASVVGGLFWLQETQTATSVIGEPATLATSQPILLLEEITGEGAPINLIGRVVSLSGVPVHEVSGDYLFWIGGPEERVPVVLLGEQAQQQADPVTEVRRGDTVHILGIIREIREVRLLDEAWAMRDEEWVELAREDVYISALRVEHPERVRSLEGPP